MLPCLLVLLGGIAPSEAEDRQATTATLVWEPGLVGTFKPGKIPFQQEPPEGTPALTGLERPRYARIVMAGTRGLTVALDALPESPRLWVDSDFDGDLSDEKRIWLKQTGSTFTRTQPVLVRYEGDDDATPLPLSFRFMPAKEPDYVQVWANVHRRGTVVLGGRLRLVALVDGHADLRFDDPKRDLLFVDLNGDGRFSAAAGVSEHVPFGEPFRAGHEGWIARTPTRSGDTLVFEQTATVPPAKPRTWPKPSFTAAGVVRTPGKTPYKELVDKFHAERNKPYASRLSTIIQIGFVGSKASLRFLQDVARTDKDDNARAAAVRGMGNKAYLPLGADAVLALTRDGNPAIRNAAAQALHQMGHPDREKAYLRLLSEKDNTVAVANAAQYYIALKQEAAAEVILAAYSKRTTDKARYTLYWNGLRKLPTGPPLPVLLAAARSDYAPLAGYALQDLHTLGHPDAPQIAYALSEKRPVVMQVGTAIAKVLGAQGGRAAVQALLGLFEEPKLHGNVRKLIEDQLRFLRDPGSIGALVLALKSKIPAVRSTAAEILAGVPSPDVTAALLKRAKKEKDAATRASLLEALGDHGDPSAISMLLKHARKRRSKDDRKDMGRRAAIRALARIGFQHAKVRKFLVGLLDSRRDVDRILALNAAGASGDARLVPRVAACLRDGVWQIRLSAINALARIRDPSSIPKLIGALEKEQEERLRDALAQALFGLTGQNFYDDHTVWKTWWGKTEATFQVPKHAPEMPADHAGPTQAGFYGIPIRSRRVVFVIDQSGSMSAPGDAGSSSDEDDDLNRLEVAVREVMRAVERLEDKARVNVILFQSTIHPWQEDLARLSRKNRSALRRHLEKQTPTGGTNLYDALEQALQTKDVDTVFLLSDGVPGAGKHIATPDILRAVRRLNQTRKVAIHCVSIGVDSDLLRRLAKAHGGRYVRR